MFSSGRSTTARCGSPRARWATSTRRWTPGLGAPNFLLKIIPHVDGTPRICELVEYHLEDVTIKGAWTGPGALALAPHALAPVAELPVIEVVSAQHILADMTLGRATVAVAARNQPAAAAVAAELGGSDRAIGVGMDVTSQAQVNAGMAEAVKAFGRIDILVSNAGIQSVGPLEQFEFAKWKQLLSVHLDGAFLTTRAALRQMYKQGTGGSIIYMGSVHSKEDSVLKAPYVTAKHGLIGLAKVVAKEGAKHGVRANVVCPGFVRTALVDKQIPEQAQQLGLSEQEVIKKVVLKDTVDGEFTTTQDVAEAALFFASFESNALTGQSLVV